MGIDLTTILQTHPVMLLFLIIGVGYLIGKIKIKGFELGPAGGVLFAGLFWGHYGYELPPIIESVGFIFFISGKSDVNKVSLFRYFICLSSQLVVISTIFLF